MSLGEGTRGGVGWSGVGWGACHRVGWDVRQGHRKKPGRLVTSGRIEGHKDSLTPCASA